jgi:hypothetical protein
MFHRSDGIFRVRRREKFVEEVLKVLFENHHEEITPGGRRAKNVEDLTETIGRY